MTPQTHELMIQWGKKIMRILLEKLTFVSALPHSHRSFNSINLNSHTLTPQNLPEKKNRAALKKQKTKNSTVSK